MLLASGLFTQHTTNEVLFNFKVTVPLVGCLTIQQLAQAGFHGSLTAHLVARGRRIAGPAMNGSRMAMDAK